MSRRSTRKPFVISEPPPPSPPRHTRRARANLFTTSSPPVSDDEPQSPPLPERRARRRNKFHFVEEDAAAKEESSEYSSQDELDLLNQDETISSSDDEFGQKKRKPQPRQTVSAPKRKRRVVKPKILLPEDVPFRESHAEVEEDPNSIEYNPLVAFISTFISTFVDLFSDLEHLPSPQDIEEGLQAEELTPIIELIFRRLLVLILNRKKELEVGRYSSALSELHSMKNSLGMGAFFPPINWKSRSEAFKELDPNGRLEFLNVLVHWSLASSEKVRSMLKHLQEDMTMPWMGADELGNHYYIVGFDPMGPDSLEFTRFRVYKESNRLLNRVSWKPIASSTEEVIDFLNSHRVAPGADGAEAPDAPEGVQSADADVDAEADASASAPDASAPDASAPDASAPTGPPLPPTDPSQYDLPPTVIEILSNLLPSMVQSDEARTQRLIREAKKARKRTQMFTPVLNEERHSRRRRNRANFFDFVRESNLIEEEDEFPSSRRRRRRDDTYEEPEPETRQQRHARLLADKQERIVSEQSPAPEDIDEKVQHILQNAVEEPVSKAPTLMIDTAAAVKEADIQPPPVDPLAPIFE